MTNYSETQINFIVENYPKWGPKYCSLSLNIPINHVYNLARQRDIKKIGTDKHPSMQKIDPRQFWDITKPEVAYFLGYFWADGFIHNAVYNGIESFTLAFEIVSEDADDIMHIMDSLGNWAKNRRKRAETWKETTTFTTNSKDLYKFLKDNGYDNKSSCEPTKILEKIPEELKHYFWRGYADGDFSISFGTGSNGAKYKSLQFSNTIDCEWTELIKLYKSLGVTNCAPRKEISNCGHSSSKVTLQNFTDIPKVINYLLKSDIGLTRKTFKMKDFLENFLPSQYKC